MTEIDKNELPTYEGAMTQIDCTVCGSAAQRPAWTVKDTLLEFPGEHKIVRCPECGTLRMSPRPPFEERRKAFTDMYPLFDWALGRRHTAVADERIARFHNQIAQISKRHQPGRLLDIGCSDGDFMLGMKRRGWDVHGIEMHKKVADYAREERGLDVTVGAEHEVDWDGVYDCITLFGVIEDLDDPSACLKRCNEHLAEDGLLVIQTHNIASLEARFFGADWFNVEAPRHVWHFTPKSLKLLLMNNGFSQDVLLHYGSAYVTERSIENRRGKVFPSSTMDRILRKLIIMPVERITPRIGQGIEIESYSRKSGANL